MCQCLLSNFLNQQIYFVYTNVDCFLFFSYFNILADPACVLSSSIQLVINLVSSYFKFIYSVALIFYSPSLDDEEVTESLQRVTIKVTETCNKSTEVESSGSSFDKDLRKLKKKLDQIENLKKKQKSGEKLEESQVCLYIYLSVFISVFLAACLPGFRRNFCLKYLTIVYACDFLV